VDGASGVGPHGAGTNTATTSFGLLTIAGTNSSDYSLLAMNASASPLLTVRGDGNVGIGTIAPTSLLHVVEAETEYL